MERSFQGKKEVKGRRLGYKPRRKVERSGVQFNFFGGRSNPSSRRGRVRDKSGGGKRPACRSIKLKQKSTLTFDLADEQ